MFTLWVIINHVVAHQDQDVVGQSGTGHVTYNPVTCELGEEGVG